jgi:hypothetical protein
VAEATLWRYRPISGDEFIATSSLLHFDILEGTPVEYVGELNNPEEWKLSCEFYFSDTGVSGVDDTVNGIINGACKVAGWLAVPKQKDLTQFNDLWIILKTKPPFGWFTASSDTLGEFEASGEAEMDLPDLDFLGTFKTILDGALALLITVSFLLFLFHRFRKFDFHH